MGGIDFIRVVDFGHVNQILNDLFPPEVKLKMLDVLVLDRLRHYIGEYQYT
jgi:hypothetical protein